MVRRMVWVALLFVAAAIATFPVDALAGGQKSAFALREKCARGELPACAEGSLYYVFGDGVNWDLAEAEHMARKACEGGDTAGCVNLSRIVLIGYKVEDKEIQDARAWLRKACVDQKDDAGCVALGWMYLRGEGPIGEQPPIALLDEKCAAGSGAACLVAGQLYSEGMGAPADAAKALERFDQSCKAGSSDGCARLGAAYEGGQGTSADAAKARSLYDQSCKAGSIDGCARAARTLRDGVGVTAAPAKADAAIAKLCGGDQARTCYARGMILKDGALEGYPNPQGMLQLYDYACKSGYTAACYRLGTHLDVGDAIPRDRAAASKHYQVACDKGMEDACTDLGVLYHHGWGVPHDEVKAIALWKDSCEGHREPLACLWYGRALRDGAGAEGDPAKAFTYINRSCNAGNGDACDELGVLYRDGIGTKPDAELAATMFRRACIDESASACRHLGEHAAKAGVDPKIATLEMACDNGTWSTCVGLGALYATGTSAPKDAARAVSLYQRACDREDMAGCAALATAHLNGCGVGADAAAAAAIAKPACATGDELSCWLADSASAPGGSTDATADRLAKMCEDGSGWACGVLGDRHLTGSGATKDAATGKRLLEESCRLGDPTACAKVGEHWLDGTLGTDVPRGVAYLEGSCRAAFDACPGTGWATDAYRGCRVLGEAYAGGKWGVAKDVEKAKPLLAKACAGGDAKACEMSAVIDPPAPPPAPPAPEPAKAPKKK